MFGRSGWAFMFKRGGAKARGRIGNGAGRRARRRYSPYCSWAFECDWLFRALSARYDRSMERFSDAWAL